MHSPFFRRRTAAYALLGLSVLVARALPPAGSVTAGQATITSSGSTLTVTQGSNRAIINWNSFSIGNGETATFNLPSSSSAVLNRVTGAQLSSLMGTLASNGQVYLLNPNGIVIGPNGRVKTGGFVASTLGLSDDQFLKGGAQTFQGSSTAGVVVLGTVKATSGDVLMVAAQVDNQGKLIARDGHVILAAGSEVLYTPGSDSHIAVAAPAPATGAAVNNGGIIKAAAVQLAAAGSPYALAVNNGGQISATAVNQVDGHVVLSGGDGDVVTSGSIAASSGANGGSVSITGGRVAVATGATVAANASGQGNGGSVRIFGTSATNFAGAVSATGGAQGGDGGQAEVSGGALSFTGTADLTAAKGRTGSLRLDPDQITVVAGNAFPPQNASDGTWSFTEDPGAQTISTGAITSLLAVSNLSLQATSGITVNAAISSASANLLEFDSPAITLNAGISLASGSVAFVGTTTGPVQQGGPPPVTIGQSLTSSSAATVNASHVTINGYSQVALNGTVQTSFLQLKQQGLAATSVAATNSGNQIATLIVGSDGSGGAGTDSYSGSFALSASGALTLEGAAAVNGGMTVSATGNLALSSADVVQGTQFTSAGSTVTLGSSGGVFENNVGTALFAGTGRRILYSSTSSGGYTDGGLGYSTFSPVAFGQDPDSGVSHVIYLATAPVLPTLTITANSFSRNYGQPDPTFTASYSGGSTSDLTTAVQFSIQGGTDIYPGLYTIIPSGAVSSTHQLSYVDGTLTVNKAPLLVTASDAARLYGAANPGFSASFSGLVNGDTAGAITGLSFGTSATTASNVGGYPITVAGGSALNYALSYAPGTLTIQPAPLLITPSLSRQYGAALSTGVPAFDFSGFVNGDSASVLTTQPTITSSTTVTSGVGTYGITASGAAAHNYAISYAPGTLTITPAPLQVTAADATRIYGAANPGFSYSVNGLLNGDPSAVVSGVNLTTGATSASGVGGYAITPAGGSAANYTLNYVSGTLSVTPASLLVKPNVSRSYGAALPSVLPASDFTGFVNGDTPASLAVQPVLSGPATSGSGVGNYALTAAGGSAANYTLSYAPGTLSVTPAPLLITANDLTRTYGAANPSLTASYSGLVNGDSPAVVSGLVLTTTATTAANVGSYPIAVGSGTAANYSIRYGPGTLSVTPAALVIAPTGSMLYGSNPTLANITYNTDGLVNGDALAKFPVPPSFTTTATAKSDIGLYSVLASGAVNPNYTIRYEPGVFSVMPQPLTLFPAALSAVYGSGGPNPGAANFLAVGLQNGDTLAQVFATPPTVSFPSVAGLQAGTYATSVAYGKVIDNNYTVSASAGTLTITPAPLLIVPNLTMTQGAAFPATLPPSDFAGFVNGDGPGSLLKQPTLAFADPLGGTVNASGAFDPNYTISYQTGSVTTIIGIYTAPTTTITPTSYVPPTVTVDPNYTAPHIYGPILGSFGAEAEAIVDAYLSTLTGTPPVTAAQVEAMLTNPATSDAMLGTLLPFVYADLASILDTPQSSWTASQAFFVQQMQAYIQAQKRAAALQAEADYEAWAQATVAEENKQINAVTGPAQVTEMAILSGNPPVPPDTFLNEVQHGMTMNTSQAAADLVIQSQMATIGNALAGGGDAMVEGVSVGKFMMQFGTTGGGNGVAKVLGKLGSKIFAQADKNLADVAEALKNSTDGTITLKIRGLQSGAQEGSVTITEADRALTAATEVVGAAGAILEVVGNAVQIGTAAAAYAKAADYNQSFQQAVNAANEPVQVADLKAMISAPGCPMLNYLTAYMATGTPGFGQSLNPNQPTMSLTGILNITSSL